MWCNRSRQEDHEHRWVQWENLKSTWFLFVLDSIGVDEPPARRLKSDRSWPDKGTPTRSDRNCGERSIAVDRAEKHSSVSLDIDIHRRECEWWEHRRSERDWPPKRSEGNVDCYFVDWSTKSNAWRHRHWRGFRSNRRQTSTGRHRSSVDERHRPCFDFFLGDSSFEWRSATSQLQSFSTNWRKKPLTVNDKASEISELMKSRTHGKSETNAFDFFSSY